MTIPSTVTLDYELIQTRTRTRTSLSNDTVGYGAVNSVTARNLSLDTGNRLIINNVTGFLFLRFTSPVQVSLQNSDFFTVASFLSVTAALNSVTILNAGTTTVDCFVVDA